MEVVRGGGGYHKQEIIYHCLAFIRHLDAAIILKWYLHVLVLHLVIEKGNNWGKESHGKSQNVILKLLWEPCKVIYFTPIFIYTCNNK